MAAAQELAESLGAEDLYSYFGIDRTSSDKEITRAYRKGALKCHPDKNPGDQKAADLFQKLSQAYDILSDAAARAAYDSWLKAKQAAKQRNAELSAKRRKMKEKLESQEAQQSSSAVDEAEAARRVQKEIERLREEGKKKIAEHEELLRQELQQKATEAASASVKEPCQADLMPTLKISWKSKKADSNNGGYNQELLENMFSRYGPLHHVLVSTKRKGKALVSFQHPFDAQRAMDTEKGLSANPLTLSWVSDNPIAEAIPHPSSAQDPVLSAMHPTTRSDPIHSVNFDSEMQHTTPLSSKERDYESLTLMRMRQAEERRRLCQQLAQQEEEPI